MPGKTARRVLWKQRLAGLAMVAAVLASGMVWAEEEVNNGQDPTKSLTRIDLRYPSSDIRYNFAAKRPGDTGRWFFPFNVMVGKLVTRSLVASVEIGVPIVDAYQVYDFKLEARIGFFF
jgi:hypothetical protein